MTFVDGFILRKSISGVVLPPLVYVEACGNEEHIDARASAETIQQMRSSNTGVG
jgi:hypothetical protein